MSITRQMIPAWVFLALLLLWLLSFTPAEAGIRYLLSRDPSIALGILIGTIVLVRSKRMEWLYAIIVVVMAEQVYVVGTSFIDEVILLFCVPRLSRRSSTKPHAGEFLVIIAFVVIVTVSAVANDFDLQVYIAAVRSYVQFYLVYLILRALDLTEPETRSLLASVLLLAIFMSLVSIVNLLFGTTDFVYRSEGVLSNPNALAGFLVFALPLVLVSIMRPDFSLIFEARMTRLIAILMLLALISSGSRAMIIGLTFGFSVSVLLLLGKTKQKLQVTIVVVLALFGAYQMTEGNLFHRFMLLTSQEYMSPDLNLRSYYSMKGWELIVANPLVGVGPGRYGGSVSTIFPSSVYQDYRILSPTDLSGIRTSDVFWPHLGAELGILGSIAFIWLVAGPLLRWWSLVAARHIRWTPLGGATAASLAGILIACSGGMYLELHLTALFYWIYVYVLHREIGVCTRSTRSVPIPVAGISAPLI